MRLWTILHRLARLVASEPRVRFRVGDHSFELFGSARSGPDKDDAWLLACAARSTVAVDVGCNVGSSTLLLLAPGTVREVVAIDANDEALAVAARNVIVNGCSSCARFFHGFVSDRDGDSVKLWTIGTGAAGSAFPQHAVTAKAKGASRMVPSVSLDALADRYGVEPDLIKIDVEGAEIEALRGATRTARANKARWLVEMHSAVPMVDNAASLLEWCESVGHRAWYLSKHVELVDPEQLANRGRCHVLLQPKAWDYPEWLQGVEENAPIDRVVLPDQQQHGD